MVKTKVNYSRLHSIGIGDGVSMELLKGCAKFGMGKCVFIGN